MHALGASEEGGNGVGNGKAAVAVPMPIDTNFLTRRLYNLVEYERYERIRPHGRGVPGSVANDNRARAAIDCGRIQPLNSFGIAAGRVFGDIGYFEAKRYCVLHGFFRGLEQELFCPSLRVTSNRTGTDKSCGSDVQPGALDDIRNWPNVILVGAGGAVRADLHLVPRNFPRQRFAVLEGTRPRSGEAEIERVNAQSFHQVQNLDFFRDRRIANR